MAANCLSNCDCGPRFFCPGRSNPRISSIVTPRALAMAGLSWKGLPRPHVHRKTGCDGECRGCAPVSLATSLPVGAKPLNGPFFPFFWGPVAELEEAQRDRNSWIRRMETESILLLFIFPTIIFGFGLLLRMKRNNPLRRQSFRQSNSPSSAAGCPGQLQQKSHPKMSKSRSKSSKAGLYCEC